MTSFIYKDARKCVSRRHEDCPDNCECWCHAFFDKDGNNHSHNRLPRIVFSGDNDKQ